MNRKFEEIMTDMKRTFPLRDGGEGCEYVFFKNKQRLLAAEEYFMFELTDGLNDNLEQVKAKEQEYEKFWTFGYFVSKKDDKFVRLHDEPVKLAFSKSTANSIISYQSKFEEEFNSGKIYRFYGGNSYPNKFGGKCYPVNLGIIKSKTVDSNEDESKKFDAPKDSDIENIDIDDDLL